MPYFENGKSGKLYAVNNKTNFLDGAKRPYGILITNTGKTAEDFDQVNSNKLDHCASWFEYPRERQNISECYPDEAMGKKNSFDAWLAGTSDGSFNMRAPNTQKVFDITTKDKGHVVYQIEKGNEKNLGSKKYDKIRITIP